jgi:hypothetical protein
MKFMNGEDIGCLIISKFACVGHDSPCSVKISGSIRLFTLLSSRRTSSIAIVLGTPWSKIKEVLRTSGRADEKIMIVMIKLISGSK